LSRTANIRRGGYYNDWVYRLSCEARPGDCAAEASFDFTQDRLRALSKEILIKKFS